MKGKAEKKKKEKGGERLGWMGWVGGSSIPAGSWSPPGSAQGDPAQPDHGAWQDIPSPRRHHAANAPRQRPGHPPRGTRASAAGKALTWGAAKVHLPLPLAKVTPFPA